MIQIKYCLNADLAKRLETYVSESEVSTWVLIQECDIHRKAEPGIAQLSGYFETEQRAAEEWCTLRSIFPELPKRPEFYQIEDEDWKNKYRLHYKPWSYKELHCVPDWYKDDYVVPDGEKAVYLDPGMAFGMSDHPSTRLCLLSLVHYRDRWLDKLDTKVVIDAGCGSGILALSAAKLGFKSVYAFDSDPVAIKTSRRNSIKNKLGRKVIIELAELTMALASRNADLILANILSGILYDNAKCLLTAVKPKGCLVLSGMFPEELEELKAHYQLTANEGGIEIEMKTRSIETWSSLSIDRM